VNTKALLLTLSLALGASSVIAPSTASAKGHASQEVFPMKAPDFKKKIEARIDRVRAVIDKKLDGHAVSAERKAAIHKLIEEAAKDVREAVTQVTADGSVTEAEANQVKKLTVELRSKVRERMRAEKSGKGSKSADKSKADKGKADKGKADKGKADKGSKGGSAAGQGDLDN
jgi:hypothetical protein